MGRAFAGCKEQAREDGINLLVKEAALLLQTRSDGELDAVLVVTADDALRIARVSSRDGLDESQIRARMLRQWSQDRMIRSADYVIENGGTRTALQLQVEILWRTLVPGA